MAINHPYFQNLTDEQIRQHINFAFEIDNFLNIQTPEDKQTYLKNYFFALTTLLVAFNDRQAELEAKLGITIDSTKLLNIIQKISFYREFRESEILPLFQKNLNHILENYPNDVTTHFLVLEPLEPVKFNKDTRKEINFKLFKRKTKVNVPAQAAIKIGEYTSKPKLYNDNEHIKTDNSRFLSKFFRTSEDFAGTDSDKAARIEKDKLKARKAFDKAYIKTLPGAAPVQIISKVDAIKAQQEKELQQRVLQQRKAEAAKQQAVAQQNDVDKLREFERIKALQNQQRSHIVQQKKVAEIKFKNEKEVQRIQKAEKTFTYADAKLSKAKVEEQKKAKYEDFSDYKNENRSTFEKLLDILFPQKYKPAHTAQSLANVRNSAKPIEAKEITDTFETKTITPQQVGNNSLLSKIQKAIKDFYYRRFVYKSDANIQKKEIKTNSELNSEVVKKQAQEIISAMDNSAKKAQILKDLVSTTKNKNPNKVSLKDRLLDMLGSDNKIGYVVEGKAPTHIDAIYEYRSKKYKLGFWDMLLGKISGGKMIFDKYFKRNQIENPLLKVADFDIDQFTISLEKTLTYPAEFLEELIFELENGLLAKNSKLFLNFSNLDALVTEKIINTHSKFIKEALNIDDKETSIAIKKYMLTAEYIDNNKKINDTNLNFTHTDFEKDFLLAQYIMYRFRQIVFNKYFAEYQLEKIYSPEEIVLTGSESRKLSNDIPTKIFNIDKIIDKDINNEINFGITQRREANNHDIATIFTVESYIQRFKNQLELILKQESKKNLTFFSSQNHTDALCYIASDVFLTKYTRSVYQNMERGELKNIKKHIQTEFKSIAAEFIQKGFSMSDNKAMIRDIYFNLHAYLSNVYQSNDFEEIDQIIEEILKATCKLIIECRLIPENFFSVELRMIEPEERINYEVKYALDVYLIPEDINTPTFNKFNETYIFTYTQETRDILNLISTSIKTNPNYIEKIINMACDTNSIKRKLIDLADNLNYDVNKNLLVPNA
jgi:hypothetical protein